jgi:Flp pilus assembly protein TadB
LFALSVRRSRFLRYFAPDPQYPVTANLTLSFSTALCLISVAWIFHRPWLGAGLLLAATSPFLYLVRGALHYQRID